MKRDEYVFGPEHAWYTARGHKIGSVSFGRKIKRPPAPQQGAPGASPLHHRALRVAGLVIAVMLAADILGDTFGNGAEIAWVALGGLAAGRDHPHRQALERGTQLAPPASTCVVSNQSSMSSASWMVKSNSVTTSRIWPSWRRHSASSRISTEGGSSSTLRLRAPVRNSRRRRLAGRRRSLQPPPRPAVGDVADRGR